MPEMTTYDHGVPSWVDIGLHDLPAGVTFYRQLLGWDGVQDMGPDAGGYTLASIAEKYVAGLSVAQQPGPPYWTTYVNVDSADDIARLAVEAGGSVVAGPMDVMTSGRMVMVVDLTGAVIAAWEPRDHIGAGLVNEPGTFVWCELSTSDLASAKAFYTDVFGWEWGGADEYAEAQVGGRSIAAAMPRPEGMPAEMPDHWLVYFGTEDVDASTDKAQELGASMVAVPPTDIPTQGRFSVVVDPEGAVFGLYKGAESS